MRLKVRRVVLLDWLGEQEWRSDGQGTHGGRLAETSGDQLAGWEWQAIGRLGLAINWLRWCGDNLAG